MQTIIIDEEFKSLLPALDKETYTSLEENLISNGCRDALILWNDILIDGHNRYDICSKNNIPFNTVNKDFASREEVLIWIISNQVSRRNLTQMQLSFFRGLHYKADKKIVKNTGGKNQHSEPDEVIGQNVQKPQSQSTVERLGQKYHVSAKTIQRDAKVAEVIDRIGEISPEAKRKILSGDVDVDKRELIGFSSKQKGDIEVLATEIEEGTYKKNLNFEPEPVKDEDTTDRYLAELSRVGTIIDGLEDDIQKKLQRLSKNGSIEKLKKALSAYINSLERILSTVK